MKIIRLLRILRPLKFISSNPNMKLMVNCLLKSIGGIFNVSLVIIIIW
ncbi:MAG: ion transporter [bacterium]